jgi:delta-1-pyrroline-5-carboxylate synthetase
MGPVGISTNASSSVAAVTIYGGPRASALLNIAEASSLHHEYSSMACTIEIVDDVFAAIDHIHHHGRHVGIPKF